MRQVLMYVTVILVMVSGMSPVFAQPPVSPLWGDLEPGPYSVGFRVIYTQDTMRSYYGETGDGYRGRPMRILVWFPGTAGKEPPMPFSGYFNTPPSDAVYGEYHAMLHARELDTAHRQFSPPDSGAIFQSLMDAPTAVVRDLQPRAGSYPLVVHSLGRNDYQQESTVLWEYLASHGYVVAVVPQVGPNETNSRVEVTPESIELQCRDIEFAVSVLLRWPSVARGRTALLGHSSGGIAATIVASRNVNIDAVVNLEGSISTADGAELLDSFPWNPELLRAPLLNLYAKGKPGMSSVVADRLVASDRYHVAFGDGVPPNMATHYDFQNWPLYSVLTETEDPRGAPARSVETGAGYYLAACRITLKFLEGFLNQDADAIGALQGATITGVPPGLVEITFQPAD